MTQGTYAHFDTSEGSFTVRLFDKEAPNTVANFVGLAEGTKEWQDPATGEKKTAPYYDGVIFHRVIDGFMIQGGDRLGHGHRRPRLQVRRRVPPVAAPQQGRGPVDGQCRTEYERQPVLHHPRADAASRQSALGFRRSRRRPGRRQENRAVKTGGQDRPITPVVMNRVTIERVA